jgi:Ca2+-binding RTX toxin-like protein
LIGGAGKDFYHVNGNDIIVELAGGDTDTLNAHESIVLGAGVHVEFLQMNNPSSTVARKLTGNEQAQTISGNAGNNTLKGMGGGDTLIASGGAGVLDGGEGNDTASFAASTTGVNIVVDGEAFQGVTNGLVTLVSIENLTGGKGTDKLIGSVVANRLEGREGADTLLGMDGDDTLRGGPAQRGHRQGHGDLLYRHFRGNRFPVK